MRTNTWRKKYLENNSFSSQNLHPFVHFPSKVHLPTAPLKHFPFPSPFLLYHLNNASSVLEEERKQHSRPLSQRTYFRETRNNYRTRYNTWNGTWEIAGEEGNEAPTYVMPVNMYQFRVQCNSFTTAKDELYCATNCGSWSLVKAPSLAPTTGNGSSGDIEFIEGSEEREREGERLSSIYRSIFRGVALLVLLKRIEMITKERNVTILKKDEWNRNGPAFQYWPRKFDGKLGD